MWEEVENRKIDKARMAKAEEKRKKEKRRLMIKEEK